MLLTRNPGVNNKTSFFRRSVRKHPVQTPNPFFHAAQAVTLLNGLAAPAVVQDKDFRLSGSKSDIDTGLLGLPVTQSVGQTLLAETENRMVQREIQGKPQSFHCQVDLHPGQPAFVRELFQFGLQFLKNFIFIFIFFS
jgi:hypothetical protein